MFVRFNHIRGIGFLLPLLLATGLMGQYSLGEAISWDGLLKETPAGLDQGRWQGLVTALKANGLSSEAARDCLAPVAEAARQGLPSGAVLARLEEGAAKKASADDLVKAGRSRLAALRTADDTLKETGYGLRNADNENLLRAVVSALESGLGPVPVKAVLARGNGGQADRMQNVVEAGETMKLNGMDDPTVGLMMVDFIDRNLRRSEVLRASRFAIQQHKAQVEGAQIRQRLWSREGAGGNVDPGAGKRQAGSPWSEAGTPSGQGAIHVEPAGAGNAGPNGAGAPNNAPVAPGADQRGGRQNGRR